MGRFLGFRTVLVSSFLLMSSSAWSGDRGSIWGGKHSPLTCAQATALQALSKGAWLHLGAAGLAHYNAGWNYPNDVVARAAFLAKELGPSSSPLQVQAELKVQDGFLPSSLYAAVPDRALNTVFFTSRADVAQERVGWECEFCPAVTAGAVSYQPLALRSQSRLTILVETGLRRIGAHGFEGRSILDVTGSSASGGSPIVRELVAKGLFFESSPVAYDLPWNGIGRPEASLAKLEKVTAYQISVEERMALQNKPLVALSSGESCFLSAERHLQKPTPARAVIWNGPTHPLIGLAESCDALHSQECLRRTSPGDMRAVQPLAISWFKALLGQVWDDTNPWWEDVFSNGSLSVPLLILVGELDERIPLVARDHYRRLSARFPEMVEFHEIKGASANVFAVDELSTGAGELPAIQAWEVVYRFLRKQIPEVGI